MNPTVLHLQILLKNINESKDISKQKQIESLFRELTGDNRLKYRLMFPPLKKSWRSTDETTFPFVCTTNGESAKKLSVVVEENKLPILTSILPYRRLKSLYSKKDRNDKKRNKIWGCFNCLSIFGIDELEGQISGDEWQFRTQDFSFMCPFCEEHALIPQGKTRLTRELLYEVEKFAYGKQMNLSEWKPLEHFTYMTIGPLEID